VFIPFWDMTPVIDPNDRFTNGIFTIVDLRMANPRPGTWENIVNQWAGDADFASGIAQATINADAAYRGEYTNTAPAGVTTVTSLLKTWPNQIGAVLVYLGDAAALPPLLHLLRGDITTFGLGAAPAADDNKNWFPVAPYRHIKPEFNLHPASIEGTYTPLIADIVGTFTPSRDGVTFGAIDGALAPELALPSLAVYPELVLAPIFAPSLSRNLAEYTDFGLRLWDKTGYDYLAERSFPTNIPGTRMSAGAATPRGADPKREKASTRDFKAAPEKRVFKSSKEFKEKAGSVGKADMAAGKLAEAGSLEATAKG